MFRLWRVLRNTLQQHFRNDGFTYRADLARREVQYGVDERNTRSDTPSRMSEDSHTGTLDGATAPREHSAFAFVRRMVGGGRCPNPRWPILVSP
jgi:hypothetical protein